MEWRPPLHLGVVAIKKGIFGSPSTKVANFTYFYLETYHHFKDSKLLLNIHNKKYRKIVESNYNTLKQRLVFLVYLFTKLN